MLDSEQWKKQAQFNDEMRAFKESTITRFDELQRQMDSILTMFKQEQQQHRSQSGSKFPNETDPAFENRSSFRKQIDEFIGQSPNEIQVDDVCVSVEEEGIEDDGQAEACARKLDGNVAAPYAHNMLDEMPSPNLIGLYEKFNEPGDLAIKSNCSNDVEDLDQIILKDGTNLLLDVSSFDVQHFHSHLKSKELLVNTTEPWTKSDGSKAIDGNEATMICIDNSDWMRNGDYSPTRFLAQADAINLICGSKTQSNPENTVGVLTMAGKRVRVLVTPTSDLSKILGCMHGLDVGGEMDLSVSIQVAQLALKHRQNKRQQQRIILFAGSPVKYDKKVLETIGRKLKKNSVSLDVVNFGEDDAEKTEKLEALVAAVNNNDSSHILHVPSGPNALSDVLISSTIFTGDGEGGGGFAAAAAAGGGSSGFDVGVDPNLDPELALALRVSMEEERARQEAAAKRAAEAAKLENVEQSTSQDVVMTESVKANIDDADLARALAMSTDGASSSATQDIDMLEAAEDDEDIQLALQLSLQDSSNDASNQAGMNQVLADQDLVSSILNSLPGVDLNDPSVKELLASMQNQSEDGKGDSETDKVAHPKEEDDSK